MLNSNKGSYLYGPGGQLLTANEGGPNAGYTDYVYFGGRLLYTLSTGEHGYTAVTRMYADRLGSTRATQTQEWIWNSSTTRNYYPYGEEVGSTANDQFKFASTYRDSATGLDYAVNRYYASGTARFLTPDPYQASGGASVPQTWNRYSYVHGDPANFRDPWGLVEAPPGFCPAEFPTCGGWDWFGVGWSWGGGSIGGGGGGGGSAPDPLSVATAGVLNQFPGLPFADAQTLGRMVLGGWAIVCVGSGVCEVVATATAAVFAGILLYEFGDWVYHKVRGQTDPVVFSPTRPGKDTNGNCNPCPPAPPPWEDPGDAHGSTSGTHWHWIIWDQNPSTCECFPKRMSGPTKP